MLTAAAALATSIAAEVVVVQPATDNPAAAGDGVQVGVGSLDGVTFTGGEAFVTRNGATEKLTKELVLSSGVTVRPDGTVNRPDGSQATLRSTQIVGFDGKICNIIPSANENPGDPRGGGTSAAAPAGSSAGGGKMTGAVVAGSTSGSSRSLKRGEVANNPIVFLGSDGVPFMATINTDGTLTRTDGVTMRADASFRAVSFGQDGSPSLGTLNNNGSITRADGTTLFRDGSVRTANGAMMAPGSQGNAGTSNNGNSNPGIAPQNGEADAITNNGAAAGRNTNSPNNSGTVNRGANGESNNTGTVNNPNGSPGAGAAGGTGTGTTGGAGQNNPSGGNNPGSTGGGKSGGASGGAKSGGAQGSNGSAGGATGGGGASGAGGASGGSAGGATR